MGSMRADLYAAGTFCRRELVTPDPEEAGAFYAQLMGWEARPGTSEEGAMEVHNNGREVAAIRRPRPELGEPRDAASWLSYIAVPSVPRSMERVALLGGEVIQFIEATADVGELAIIADPAGARVALCAAQDRAPCKGPATVPGGCYWTELATRDAQRAAVFYAQLLGWKARVVVHNDEPSTLFLVEDTPVAGLLQLHGVPPIPPSNWMVSFAVASAEQTVARAEGMGARLASPLADIPGVGLAAGIIDPQGGPFSIMEPVTEE